MLAAMLHRLCLEYIRSSLRARNSRIEQERKQKDRTTNGNPPEPVEDRGCLAPRDLVWSNRRRMFQHRLPPFQNRCRPLRVQNLDTATGALPGLGHPVIHLFTHKAQFPNLLSLSVARAIHCRPATTATALTRTSATDMPREESTCSQIRKSSTISILQTTMEPR